jgi:hypothetical protein
MALSDSVFAKNLQEIFDAMRSGAMSDADYAQKLAKCIDDQIKTAQVNAGISVQVDPNSGLGATSGPGALS